MNITVVKIKLLNDGMKGMKYVAVAPRIKDNFIINSSIDTTYPIPIPNDITALIQRMKRYLLHMSGHWQPEYDQFILKGELVDVAEPTPDYYKLLKLFQNTTVEEISRVGGKYSIAGFYLNDWKFPIKVSISGISNNSGYDNYEKLDKGMTHIFTTITDFINEKRMRAMDARQYMLNLWGEKQEMVDRLEGLDDEQVLELQIKLLEEKGCIVLNKEDIQEEKKEEDAPGFIKQEETDDEKIEEI